MLAARGDLAFSGMDTEAETRDLTVSTVEILGTTPKVPVVQTNMQEITLSDGSFLEESEYSTPDTVRRDYLFKVGLRKGTPVGTFSGEIAAQDPWDSRFIQRLRVHGDIIPPIRVVPSRIVVRATEPARDSYTTKFLVLSNPAASDLVAELVPAEKPPFVISPITFSQSGRQASFAISSLSKDISPGTYHIRVGRSSGADRITVPVVVHPENSR